MKKRRVEVDEEERKIWRRTFEMKNFLWIVTESMKFSSGRKSLSHIALIATSVAPSHCDFLMNTICEIIRDLGATGLTSASVERATFALPGEVFKSLASGTP
jgi:hypothetical protein